VTWLLLMIIAEVNGELSVQVLSDHKTMAECHVAGTKIQWEEQTLRLYNDPVFRTDCIACRHMA
jgi:hypothetical protein